MCLGFRLFQKQRLSRLVLETAGVDRQKESHYCSGEKDACALLQVADIRRVLRPSSGAFAKSIARAITAVSILSFVSFSVKSGSFFSCTFLQIRFHANRPLDTVVFRHLSPSKQTTYHPSATEMNSIVLFTPISGSVKPE